MSRNAYLTRLSRAGKLGLASVIALAAFGFCSTSRATITTIASWHSSTSADYTYVGNSGGSSTFNTIAGLSGTFSFDPSTGLPSNPIAATITLSATTTASVVGTVPTGQGGWGGSFSIIGATGSGYDGQNLLSGTFTGGNLTAATASSATPQFSAEDGIGSLSLTSDFVSMLPPESFSLTLAAATMSGTTTSGGRTYFNNFVGGDAGTSAATVAPEPSTIAMALTALPLLGLGYRRARRRQS